MRVGWSSLTSQRLTPERYLIFVKPVVGLVWRVQP